MKDLSKICNICFLQKPLNAFYKNEGMSDGYQNRCISCTKIKSMERYGKIMSDPILKEKEKKRGRDKYYKLYRTTKKPINLLPYKSDISWAKNFPEKKKAHSYSQHIQKTNNCNHLHHWSYNELHWKDVIELSVKDHYLAHMNLIYDQTFLMYRSINNILLDTKKKHINYLISLEVTICNL